MDEQGPGTEAKESTPQPSAGAGLCNPTGRTAGCGSSASSQDLCPLPAGDSIDHGLLLALTSLSSRPQEKRIYDLKKKNQELEKFKFVLDYNIKELKKQIEPRENEIKVMKKQIQEVRAICDNALASWTQVSSPLFLTGLKARREGSPPRPACSQGVWASTLRRKPQQRPSRSAML